jgi:hypothetical protein
MYHLWLAYRGMRPSVLSVSFPYFSKRGCHEQASYELTFYDMITFASVDIHALIDTRRRATAPLLLFNKRFTRFGEMKILLESPSSNLRELEIPN